jgi:hypothetical protein
VRITNTARTARALALLGYAVRFDTALYEADSVPRSVYARFLQPGPKWFGGRSTLNVLLPARLGRDRYREVSRSGPARSSVASTTLSVTSGPLRHRRTPRALHSYSSGNMNCAKNARRFDSSSSVSTRAGCKSTRRSRLATISRTAGVVARTLSQSGFPLRTIAACNPSNVRIRPYIARSCDESPPMRCAQLDAS